MFKYNLCYAYRFNINSQDIQHIMQFLFLQCYHCSALTQIHFYLCKMSENKCQSVSKVSNKVLSLLQSGYNAITQFYLCNATIAQHLLIYISFSTVSKNVLSLIRHISLGKNTYISKASHLPQLVHIMYTR